MNEQAHKYTKYGIWATLLATIIGGAITLYTHFDSKGLKVEQTPSSTESKNKEGSASVSIKKIQLTPADFEIPSSFYIEIENGFSQVAKDITIVVDFGEAKIDRCSVKPNDESNIQINGDDYILKLKVNEILKNESLYINCLTSLPAFKKVLITGGNVLIDRELTFASYKNQLEEEPTSGWYSFFSFLAGIFCIYLLFVNNTWYKQYLGVGLVKLGKNI